MVSVFALSGCSALGHMDQLLTLKSFSDDQAAMDKDVARQNKRFEALTKASSQDSFLKQYPTKARIQKTFGDPIFVRPETKDGRDVELWLYRRATEYFNSDKIYLYFDPAGTLISREFVQGQTTK